MPDPIHYAATEPEDDDVEWGGPGWYFWEENWAHRQGPYKTREAANAALEQYIEELG